MTDGYGCQRGKVTPALQVRFRKVSAITISKTDIQVLATLYPAMSLRAMRRKYAMKVEVWARMVRESTWTLPMRFTGSVSRPFARSTETFSRFTKGLQEKTRTRYQCESIPPLTTQWAGCGLTIT